MRRRNRALLAIAAGAVAATGFAPIGAWPLTVAGLAILSWLMTESASRRGAFLTGWFFGVGHFTVGNNWIATAFTYQAAMPHWLGWIAVIALSFYLALFPALATLGVRLTGARGVAVIPAFGAAWIVTEWLRSWVFSGFAWNPIGVIWVDSLFGVSSRWIGTYGLSGVTVALAAAFAVLAGQAFRRDVLVARPAAGIGMLGAGLIASFALLPAPSIPASGALVAIVQPNIGQDEKHDPALDQRNVAKTARLSGPPSQRPRLLLWPEAAVPDFLESGYPTRFYDDNFDQSAVAARMRLARVLGPRDLLVAGAVNLEFADGQAVGARNGVTILTPGARIAGFYAKAHLVPYGEYLPMRSLLEPIGLSRLVPGSLDFWPGPGPQTFDLGRFGQMGVQICYEIIFSGQVVDPNNRPDFLFNPSNDAWFGSFGPPQHLAQARLRAIEEGLTIVRATPTGISAIIDADGHVRQFLEQHRAGRIDARLPVSLAPTLFARHGNALPLILAGVALLCAVALRRRDRYDAI